MAQVKLNPILDELRGQLGEVVFKRYGDKTVISRKPDMSNVKPSEAQLAPVTFMSRPRITKASTRVPTTFMTKPGMPFVSA